MAMTALATKPVSLKTICDWLYAEAETRGAFIHIYPNSAETKNGKLHLHVYVGGGMNAYENSKILTDLMFDWNDQEPAPDVRLWLLPAPAPKQQAANEERFAVG